MAWRTQGITGSNNIPLGSRRKFGGDSPPPGDDGGYNPSQPSGGMSDGNFKRGRSPERGEHSASTDTVPRPILTSLQLSKQKVARSDARREIDGEMLLRTRQLA